MRINSRQSGQSLVETAVILPVLLLLVLNGVNLGYFYLIALNMVTAPRSGVQYSMTGFDTTAAVLLPPAGPATAVNSVSYITYLDMAGAVPTSATASVHVCSKILGVLGSGTSQTSKCSSFGSVSFPNPSPDPEAPWFVLNRLDVSYTFVPLIPGTPFGVALLPTGVCTAAGLSMTCTYATQMSMRAMD